MAAKIMNVAFPEKVIDMWRKGCGCDTTIICEEDISLQAHSLVLCSVSDKLDNLLTSKQNKIIHTPYVKSDVWKVLLETVYTGVFKSSRNFGEINDVLYVAKCFDMNELLHALENFKKELKSETNQTSCNSNESLGISNCDSNSQKGSMQKTNCINAETMHKLKEYVNKSLSDKERELGQVSQTNLEINTRDTTKRKRGRPPKKVKNVRPTSTALEVTFDQMANTSDSKVLRKDELAMVKIKPQKADYQKPNPVELGNPSTVSRESRRRGVRCKTCNLVLESYSVLMKHTCGKESAACSAKPDNNDSSTLVYVDIIKTEGHNNLSGPNTSRTKGWEIEDITDVMESQGKRSQLTSMKRGNPLSGKKWLKRKGLLNDFEKSSKKVARTSALEEWSSTNIWSEKQAEFDSNGEDSGEDNNSDDEMLESGMIKQETVDNGVSVDERKCLCFKCGENCISPKVRCALCFLVVKRDVQHMDQRHPFTPKTNSWVFRCNCVTEEIEQVENKHILLSAKMIKRSGQQRQQLTRDKIALSHHKCFKCKKYFQSLADIKRHFIIRHQIVLKTCTVCESGFQYSYYLRDHQHFCQGGEMYKCKDCGETLGGLNAWTSHVEKHSENCGEKRTTVENQEIQLPTETKAIPVQHGASEDGSKMQETKVVKDIARKGFCLECRETCTAAKVICLYCFQIVDRLSSHLSTQHPFSPVVNTWVYSCTANLLDDYLAKGTSICSKVQIHSAQMQSQNETAGSENNVEQQVNKTFLCQTCNHTFSTFETLMNHINHHFLCHVCNGMFDSENGLADHFELEHVDIAFNSCQICGMGFADAFLMDCHKYYCAGGSILLCKECDMVFAVKSQLDDHIEKFPHHTESQPVGDITREPISQEQIVENSITNRNLGASKTTDLASSTQDEFTNKPIEVCQIVSDVSHKMVCLVCGPGCTGNAVQCGYCAERVPVVYKKSHFDEFHPSVPCSSLWPVYCKKARLRRGSNEGMLARQIVSLNTSDSENSESSQIQTLYNCCQCDTVIDTSEEIIDHLKGSHNVKAVDCSTCGMILYAHQNMLLSEHQYFCQGGILYQCSYCQKVSGSEKTAALHRRGIHKSFYKAEPWSNTKGQVPMNTAEGGHGYEILCVGCRGKCEQGNQVMCGLCRELVKKDDVHMKVKHASTPSNIWVVCCNFKMMAALEKSPKIYMGQKIGNLPEPFKYKCLECTIGFEDESALKEHIADEHAGRVFIVTDPLNKLFSLTCQHCDLILMCTRNDFLVDHVQFCSSGSLHMCNMCGTEFASYEKLSQHKMDMDCGLNQIKRKKAEQDGSKFSAIPPGFKLQCAECDFSTTILRELKDHNKFMHGYTKYEVNQICQVCFKVFRKRSQRERHEEEQHLEKSILCDMCGEAFHTKTQYMCHKRYHHEGKRLEICEKQKIKRALASAKECSHCGKQFKSPYLLNQHVRIYHEKSLAITCHICGKSFLAKHRLLTHLNRHKGVKPYKCTVCPYTDYTGALVNKHMRKQHPGIEIAYKKTYVTQKEEEESNEDFMMLENADSQAVIEESFYQGNITSVLPQEMVGVQPSITIEPQQVGITSSTGGIMDLAVSDPNIIVDENSADPHVILDENMYKYIIFK